MNVRAIGHKIYSFFQQYSSATVREVAAATGTSKSSVQRQRKAIARRNQNPESCLWETDEGFLWLIRLVCATIYMFGIRGGIGMETIAEFFV